MKQVGPVFGALGLALAVIACGDSGGNMTGGGNAAVPRPEKCAIATGEAPDSSPTLGCRQDFDLLASTPLDVSIPGARSVKFVLDQGDGDTLYFQNTKKYQIHWQFASKNLSGNGKPIVPALSGFNQTEYFAPDRRFILGSITYYEAPNAWTVEFAPYDTASATMMQKAFKAIEAKAYFGPVLALHPTSQSIEREAQKLAGMVAVRTTDDLFAKTTFQALNTASSVGRLRFLTLEQLKTECLSFRDIVVLDEVPNNLTVTVGIVTQGFQTPLSHINVLARNRNIPNMWLRDAFTNPTLRAHENQWVKLSVTLSGFTIEPATVAAADAWWDAHKPAKLTIPKMDTSKTGLWDVKKIIDRSKPLGTELKAAILAFGGKGTHYAAMAGAEIVPMASPSGFIIPVFFYDQFMQQNGFYSKVDALLADPTFSGGDCKQQDARLQALQTEIEHAPVDAAFEKLLNDKLAAEYAGLPLRYRSSSTAEDVGGFTGAGLYTSKTGMLGDANKSPLEAIRKVWASVWYQRGFQERDYRQVDQKAVGMAILAHPAFKDETATGVAQTANSYDPSGLQEAFVVNAQVGDGSVTLPDPGDTTDQFIYYYSSPGRPIEYIQHSNKIAKGATILSPAQANDLANALEAISNFFRPVYGPPPGSTWYAMEVDFKFDIPPGGTTTNLYIKQARPLPSPFGDAAP